MNIENNTTPPNTPSDPGHDDKSDVSRPDADGSTPPTDAPAEAQDTNKPA